MRGALKVNDTLELPELKLEKKVRSMQVGGRVRGWGWGEGHWEASTLGAEASNNAQLQSLYSRATLVQGAVLGWEPPRMAAAWA